MTRRIRRLTLVNGVPQKPDSGYHWFLVKGLINHVTGTDSALSCRAPEAGGTMMLGYIRTEIPSANYTTSDLDEITIAAVTYLVQLPIDIKGTEITPNEELYFAGDANATAAIWLVEVSDDELTGKPAITPTVPTKMERVEWWQ